MALRGIDGSIPSAGIFIFNMMEVKNVNYEAIPIEMRKAKRWVCWSKEKRNGKYNNVPKTVHNRSASHSNPDTWSSFSQANSARKLFKFDGVSFALGDSWAGFDFDNVYNKKTKEWHDPSKQIIELLVENGAYIEFSPSGNGVHAILWTEGLLDDEEFVELKRIITSAKSGFKKEWKDESGAAIEFYHGNRILTTTGDKISNCQPDFSNGHHKDAVKEACKSIINSFGLKKRKKSSQVISNHEYMDDNTILKLASSAANGAKFQDLLNGDWQDYGKSQSSADLAFLNMLAFYTGKNADQMKRLFEESGLYREDKGETYIETSIQRAIDYCQEVYQPKQELEINTKLVKKVMKEKPNQKQKVLPNVYTYNLTDDDTVEPRKSNEIASEVMKLIEKEDPNKVKIFVKENQLGRIRYNTRMKRVSEDYTQEVTSSIFEEFTREDIKGSLNRIANSSHSCIISNAS